MQLPLFISFFPDKNPGYYHEVRYDLLPSAADASSVVILPSKCTILYPFVEIASLNNLMTPQSMESQ
jgi:hypothetical protein